MGFLNRSTVKVAHQQETAPERSEEVKGVAGIRERLKDVAITDKKLLTIRQFKRQKKVEQKQGLIQLDQKKEDRLKRVQELLAKRKANAA